MLVGLRGVWSSHAVGSIRVAIAGALGNEPGLLPGRRTDDPAMGVQILELLLDCSSARDDRDGRFAE